MKVVIQRVLECSVFIKDNLHSKIDKGMLILLGVSKNDSFEDVKWLASKISKLRIFEDQNALMNKSVIEIDGEIIVVSQFTLHSKTKKGNRPSYINAAHKEKAMSLYTLFIEELFLITNKKVSSGSFGEDMQISLVNDGPVTIIIDTENKE